jgi:hypothetical protein
MSVKTGRSCYGDGGFVSSVHDLLRKLEGELIIIRPEIQKKDENGKEYSGIDYLRRILLEGEKLVIILCSELPKENFIYSDESGNVAEMLEKSNVGYIERPIGPRPVADMYKKLA